MTVILSDFMTEYALKIGVVLLIALLFIYFVKLFKSYSNKKKDKGN
jgi:hypothetical protein